MVAHLDQAALEAHKRQNAVHTVLLFTGLAAIVAVSAVLLFGMPGLAWAAIMLGATLLMMPSIPPEMIMRMYRGRLVLPRPGDQLSEVLDIIVERAGLSKRPALYVVPSLALNAFAAGKPDHAAIAVTEGLLRRLSLREIAGVLAHEISHVRNNDLWVMGIADAVTRVAQVMAYVAIGLAAVNVWAALQGEPFVSWWAVAFLYAAPLLSSLLQLGLSRAREYDADAEAAELTGDPLGLAAALRTLEHHTGRMWEDLMPPAPGRRVAYPSLLRSHPPTEERIRRLVDLSTRPALPPIALVDRPSVSLVGFGPVAMRPRVRFPGVWF